MALNIAQPREIIFNYDSLWRTVYEYNSDVLQDKQLDSSVPTPHYTARTGSIFNHQDEAKIRDYSTARKHLALLRLFLMRCECLYFTANILECKPGEHPQTSGDNYYSDIRKFATKAGQLAESLDNRGLQARCQYWAGHGCGGMRDWLAAKDHFAAAIKLDVPHDADAHARSGTKGLKRKEKEDVWILLKTVTRNHEEYLCKDSSDRYGDFEGPSWTPERDRLIREARNQNGRNLRTSYTTENDKIIAGANKVEDFYRQGQIWQTFTEAEKQYIRHGSQSSKKHYDSISHNHLDWTRETVVHQDRNSSYSSSPTPSNYPSKNTTPQTKTLEDELADIGDYDTSSRDTTPEMKTLEDELADFESYDSSSSTRSSSSSSSPLLTIEEPPTRLGARRDLMLSPINTSNNKRATLEKVIRGSSDAAEGSESNSPMDSVLGSFTAADGIGLGIHSPVDSHHGGDKYPYTCTPKSHHSTTD
jgi:hypothetical protein